MNHLKTDLIVYNSEAKHVKFTKSKYKVTIDNLNAGGMTNFVSAFKKVLELVSEAGELLHCFLAALFFFIKVIKY